MQNNGTYEDERLAQVESDKRIALTENEKMYGGMIDQADKYFQSQETAIKNWGETQKQIQQDNTDFAIEQIEQQKQQVQNDYKKEQSAAYADYQKQSNQYGVNAEQMASSGMKNTGYSESSKVAMHNASQNRVALARESVDRAMQGFNNAMAEARLQNNAALAEIAIKTLQQSLSLSLQGFQYENQLLLEKATQKANIENTYHNRYLNILDQINNEKTLAEQIRQYNADLAEKQRQFDVQYVLSQIANGGNSQTTDSGGNYPTINKDDNNSSDEGGIWDNIVNFFKSNQNKFDPSAPNVPTINTDELLRNPASELADFISESPLSANAKAALAKLQNRYTTNQFHGEGHVDGPPVLMNEESLKSIEKAFSELGLTAVDPDVLDLLINSGYIEEYAEGSSLRYRVIKQLPEDLKKITNNSYNNHSYSSKNTQKMNP